MIKRSTNSTTDTFDQYLHNETRKNNPQVGLVTPKNDIDKQKKYKHDPHLDPELIWAGKKENNNLEVDTVSLHTHERIDPLLLIENLMRRKKLTQQTLVHYFEKPENNPPLRTAIQFYQHDQSWSNRLITGDSLLIMNSLLDKEGMAGKIQMIYIDPPYGIKYGSNFQPFTNKRSVKDGSDEDLTQEPETIRAFRDTWELGIHSYLTYLRNRLLLSKELLSDSGSCFVQISDDNLHHVREVLDEIFGSENFINMIVFSKTATGLQTTKNLSTRLDYILWYAKNKNHLKYHKLFEEKDPISSGYDLIDLPDGSFRKLTKEEINDLSKLPKNAKLFTSSNMTKPGPGSKFEIKHNGKVFSSGKRWWGTTKEGIEQLFKKNRILESGETLRYKRYFDDYPVKEIDNLWLGYGGVVDAVYVVQTNPKIVQNCMLMATDPGDLVFDPTCGSGTTAYVSEKFGRRWITCDTSRVATTIAKQRLMMAVFDYYELFDQRSGVSSGFKYKKIPHITMASVANNEPTVEEILYDQPVIDQSKKRISGPFTLEAVPSPMVKSFDTEQNISTEIDVSISRTGETLRQDQWRDELLKAGIRGKGGQRIEFSRVELFPSAQWLHADAETKEAEPKRVVVSFGPDFAPLEQRQVANAIEEAQHLIPKPKIILFAAFQFDPESAKDIDETDWPGVTLLKIHMNGDLFTEDLKKKRSSSESFWLVGQPDVELKKQKDGKYSVEVRGFDYYNTKTGEMESGDSSKIAMWELDTDYDGRSLYPKQIFFPMSGISDTWSKLVKSLKAEIDEEKIEQYQGTISLPFDLGINKKVAVKIIDDRGIESLRIIRVK
jgi:adenine-specific DNA-methyltransferase